LSPGADPLVETHAQLIAAVEASDDGLTALQVRRLQHEHFACSGGISRLELTRELLAA
jgi:hypothetical protein